MNSGFIFIVLSSSYIIQPFRYPPPLLSPPSIKCNQFGIMVPKDAQCFEMYEKIIFSFNKILISSFLTKIVDKKFRFAQILLATKSKCVSEVSGYCFWILFNFTLKLNLSMYFLCGGNGYLNSKSI